MRPRLALVLLLGLLAGGCAGPERVSSRVGYAVDAGHPAASHSSRVRHLILHYTDGDETDALATLTGPRVSVHYVLPLPARRHRGAPLVYQLVDESRRAWHAGASAWQGRSHLNDTAIGIEIVNAGPEVRFVELERRLDGDGPGGIRWAPYPEAQIEALIALSRDIIARHDIAPTEVLGHADIAPTRKIDPGPAFPWQRLYRAGIGAWPDAADVRRYRQHFAARPPDLTTLQRALHAWGYALPISGEMDATTRAVLRAFQMHFRPADYRGYPDVESAAILWALLAKYRPEALATLSSVPVIR